MPALRCAGYGFAFGGRKHIGRSREVRRPAGASRIAGMQFTTTEHHEFIGVFRVFDPQRHVIENALGA